MPEERQADGEDALGEWLGSYRLCQLQQAVVGGDEPVKLLGQTEHLGGYPPQGGESLIQNLSNLFNFLRKTADFVFQRTHLHTKNRYSASCAIVL